MKSWVVVWAATLLSALAATRGVADDGPAAQTSTAVQGEAKGRRREALRQACQADAERLCTAAGAEAADRPLVRCLVENKEQLGPVCLAALKHARRVASFRHRCGKDVEAHCAGIEPGEGRILTCLKQKGPEVSSACQQRLAKRGERKGQSSLAALADEAIAEVQAKVESLAEELVAIPEEAVLASPEAEVPPESGPSGR